MSFNGRSYHHNTSSSVANALNPANGYRGELQRRGIKPTDHAKQNRLALKQKQDELRRKKEKKEQEEETQRRRQSLRGQYSYVTSKIQQQQGSRPTSASSDSQRNFLRKGTNKGRRNSALDVASNSGRSKYNDSFSDRSRREEDAMYYQEESAKREIKPRVPTRADLTSSSSNSQRSQDFIARNKQKAAEPTFVKEVRTPPSASRKKDFGKVPKYLIQRQRDLAEKAEMKRRLREEEQVPNGMVLMSEEERLSTLEVLFENRALVEADINKLPLKIETMGQRKRLEALELKLAEIEKAQKLFSKKRVYITQ
mmetsp:Transcript_2149/g.3941  ORF Transcript_2149/g.3941 Transcript_2149/m.3941 type:complete len:311 (-) Transcript_2149:143-1075(-)